VDGQAEGALTDPQFEALVHILGIGGRTRCTVIGALENSVFSQGIPSFDVLYARGARSAGVAGEQVSASGR